MFGIKFNRNRGMRRLAEGRRPVIEGLEGRTMMSTTISIASGRLQSVVENQPMTNNTVALVAGYDAQDNELTDLSGFTFKIHWGDGTADSDGTLGPIVSGHFFAVEGTHTYKRAGHYPISVHVDAGDGTSADQQVEQAVVSDASMALTPHITTTTAGQQFTAVLSDLADGNVDSQKTDFTADIRWGDNTIEDLAQITDSGGGQFELSGSHTYAKPGQYSAQVIVTDWYDQMVSTNCLINVGAATAPGTNPGTTPPGTTPTTPKAPTTPTNPATPANPPKSGPTTPTTPSSPTTPSNPTTPGNPTNPTTPTSPAAPTKPITPTTPSQPTSPVPPTTPTQPAGNLAWGAKVSADFKAEVQDIAIELGVEPNDLMGLMAYQTGQTFNPKVKNRVGTGGVGLIQFTAAMAKAVGTTPAKLAKMTSVQQLVYVEKYLHPYAGNLASVDDMEMAILAPAAIGQPDTFEVFKKGTKGYSQNKALDSNHDGVITRAEATARVDQALELGETPANEG